MNGGEEEDMFRCRCRDNICSCCCCFSRISLPTLLLLGEEGEVACDPDRLGSAGAEELGSSRLLEECVLPWKDELPREEEESRFCIPPLLRGCDGATA